MNDRAMENRRYVAAFFALCALNSGCIAHMAYGPLPEGEGRARARRNRAITDVSVGTAELALAAGIGLLIASQGLLPAESDDPYPDTSGAHVTQGAKDLGASILGTIVVGTIGVAAGVSGIGDVVCGIQGFAGGEGCDAMVRSLHEADQSPPSPNVGPFPNAEPAQLPKISISAGAHTADQ